MPNNENAVYHHQLSLFNVFNSEGKNNDFEIMVPQCAFHETSTNKFCCYKETNDDSICMQYICSVCHYERTDSLSYYLKLTASSEYLCPNHFNKQIGRVIDGEGNGRLKIR